MENPKEGNADHGVSEVWVYSFVHSCKRLFSFAVLFLIYIFFGLLGIACIVLFGYLTSVLSRINHFQRSFD